VCPCPGMDSATRPCGHSERRSLVEETCSSPRRRPRRPPARAEDGAGGVNGFIPPRALALAAREMRWITREGAKVDRVACPWLIRKFIDSDAEFVYVPKEMVFDEAKRLSATPFDIE